MSFLQLLRKKSFWTLDALKGSGVKKHYDEIKFHLENYHSDQSIEYRKKNLERLLEHAVSNTPFYSNIKPPLSLNKFPIINKNTVREHYDKFKSDRYYKDKNKHAVVTSGSTGTPFKLWHDENKRKRNTAEIIYFSELAGYSLGARLLYAKVWNDINKKSTLKQFLENIQPVNVFNYDDNDLNQLIKTFEDCKEPCSLVAFGSTLETLSRYLQRINSPKLDTQIISIVSNSDSLSNWAKDSLEKYIGVSPMSRYSNMENGMLAQQVLGSGYNFKINWSSFHIEILDPYEDNPVPFGTKGRVVITDLFNYCMPLIRYETGDIAVMDVDPHDPEKAPFFKSIEGRKVDALFDTQGNLVTSHIVTVNMWKYDELKQYQFIQLGEKEYEFILNPIKEFTKEEEIIEEFKEYLGADADIRIKYVNEIPLLRSGKRRLLVNKMQA